MPIQFAASSLREEAAPKYFSLSPLRQAQGPNKYFIRITFDKYRDRINISSGSPSTGSGTE